MLGSELRQIRERQGLGVRELAARASLSPEAISAIERGARYPTLQTLEALASALGVKFVIGPDETIIDAD